MVNLLPAGRVRQSPFYDATVAEGAEQFLIYNRMLIPRGYGDTEAEYWRLMNGVSMWDVAAQRLVQLEGPDAGALAQVLCARDLSAQQEGQGKYAAICDHQGILLNDPIVQKISDTCYWLSIANSDIWMWARAVAGERGFQVEISEPDASPMAIQGPKAEDVTAALFGDWVRSLKYFWFRHAQLHDIPVIVARSGWSKQGGFEIYLLDGTRGTELWNIVKEAGAPFGIGPGYPNPSERTESGLINYDVDVDDQTNPFEVRMGRFVDVELDADVIGLAALRRIKAEGAKRHQLGIVLDVDQEREDQSIRYAVEHNGRGIGHMTHQAWSFGMKRLIGYALVSSDVPVGSRVEVLKGGHRVTGELCEIPFTF